MSAARGALDMLLGALAEAVEPSAVGGPEDDTDVRVGAVSLTRLGRSGRDGPVLDLELRARVLATGPDALEDTERMLVALERDSRFTVEPCPVGREGGSLGFDVRIRVPVRLDEPVAPLVNAPLRLDVRPARLLAGVVLDADGAGLPDAVVRAGTGGQAVVADSEGRFRVLGTDAGSQQFVVEVRGSTRLVEAATDTVPVVIRWK